MTAPLTTLRRAMQRPTPNEIADRSNRSVTGVSGASGDEELATTPQYRLDNAIEYLLSPRGRENLGLITLAASSIALIWVLHHA